MPLSALILIADGTEEIEFVTVYDLLTRAGIACTSASVDVEGEGGLAKCSRGVRILPDVKLADLDDDAARHFSTLVIPGGMPGAKTLAASPVVQSLVSFYATRSLGMICAGPLVALEAGLWKDTQSWVMGKMRVTSHPSVRAQLQEKFTYVEESIVKHGKVITSRGPGTAIPFALALIRELAGPQKAAEVEGPLMLPSPAAYT